MTLRHDGHPSVTRSGPEVERALPLREWIINMSKHQSLDRILESAVVASWADLMRGVQTGLIHIEYGFAPSGTLDSLQVWLSSTRGHWVLACSYWMSASTFHGTGVYFENGYESDRLARILESVMQQQNAFALPVNLGRQGLLQIPKPSEEESVAAAASVKDVFCRLGAVLAPSALA
jgi:hypothetical protein